MRVSTPADIRVDLEVDLVGLELHQRIAGGDGIAFLLQPPRDARFDDGFAELRNNDVHGDSGYGLGT